MLNERKQSQRLHTIHFHLYDFLKKKRKKHSDREQCRGCQGLYGECVTIRYSRGLDFGGRGMIELFGVLIMVGGYTAYDMHTLKFIEMHTTKGQCYCMMF